MPAKGERDWGDTFELQADGIGPLGGLAIRMTGLYGGGLAISTPDGWSATRFALDWPDESLLLEPPWVSVLCAKRGEPLRFTKIAVESEVRAWGFSPTGRTLILAASSDVTFFARSGGV